MTRTTNLLIGIEEMGGRVTTLRPAGSRIEVWSELRDDGQPANGYSADMLHFYLVLCVALAMAYPRPRGTRRLLVLAAVIASIFLFHVVALLVTVENTYANALVEVARRNYSPTESMIYRWLYQFFAYLAVQLLPAAVLIILYVRYGGFGRGTLSGFSEDSRAVKGEGPARSSQGGTRSLRVAAIAASATAVVFLAIAGTIHIPKVRARRAENLCTRGSKALIAGSAEEASRLFADAISLNPRFLEAHDGAGNAFMAEGHADQALAAYLDALKLNPDYFSSRFGLATSLESLGRGDEAIAEFEKAQELSPSRWEPYFNRALLLLKKNRTVQAEAALRRTVELSPSMADARFQLAKLLITTHHHCEAVPHLEAYLSLAPDSKHAALVRNSIDTYRKECSGS